MTTSPQPKTAILRAFTPVNVFLIAMSAIMVIAAGAFAFLTPESAGPRETQALTGAATAALIVFAAAFAVTAFGALFEFGRTFRTRMTLRNPQPH